MFRTFALPSFLCLLSACFAFGQSAGGFGSISGVVLDSSGATVGEATVIVDNGSKGIHRELTTTDSGVFSAPSLVPAPGYKVTITKPGFANFERNEIRINVGQDVSLTPRLGVSQTSTQVDVSSEAPIVETTKTNNSQVVDSNQILNLPINGRRVDQFVLLTPGVTTDGQFGLLSFRGTPGGNTFLTDGNDTTNSFYDENAARTRTINISQDAVQEFQVVTEGFSAEYGHASGGVVNTITRSGSNDFHGTGFWFFRNRTLNATDIFAQGYNPPEWRHQFGGNIAGRIIKDKLFFFLNFEEQRRNFPLSSSNINNQIFNDQGVYAPRNANGQCNATPAQCQAAIGYLQSRVVPQLIARGSTTLLPFAKFDWRPNDRNAFSLSGNYLDFRSPNGIQTQSSLTNGSGNGNNADTTVFDRTARLSWTNIVSPNIVNELRFGYFKDRQYDPASAGLLPSFGPVALTVNNLGNVGYAANYPRLNPSEQRFEINDVLSQTVGKHNLKYGFTYDHVQDFVTQLINQYGTYNYPSLTAFAQDFTGNTTGAKRWATYSQRFGNPTVDTSVNEYGAFIQDQFRATSKLTISPGIRYEFTSIPQLTQINPSYSQTGIIPQSQLNWAPRIGLAYALNDKTVVRANYGIFYNRFVTSTIQNLFANNGLYQQQTSLNSNTNAQLIAGPVFPFALPQQPSAVAGSGTIAYADAAFRNAYSQQAQFAVERQLTRNTSFTASYIWSRTLHLPGARNANLRAPSNSYTYPIVNSAGVVQGSYTTPVYLRSDLINPALTSVIQLDTSSNAYYNGLLLQVNKRYSSWFQGSAAYTWSHSIDYNVGGAGNTIFTPSSPTSVFNGNYANEKGSSSLDQRHRLTLTAVANPKFTNSNNWAATYLVNNWQLSVISIFASSLPLAPTIATNNLVPNTFGGGSNVLLNTNTINGLGGSSRVPFASLSAIDIDQLYRTDARLTKTIPVGERFKLMLQFEATNVFNTRYFAGTGAREQRQYQTTNLGGGRIGLAPFPNYYAPLQTQTSPDGTTARRAQVSLRFMF